MRILAIDDKIETFREALADALPEYELRCAPDGRAGLFYLEQDPTVDLVLLDIKMPPTVGAHEDREGIETLRRLRERRPDLPVIMLSVFQEIDLVIEAIQLGAFYYLVKPLDVEKLRSAVERALDEARGRRENEHLRGAIDARDRLLEVVQPDAEERLGRLIGRSLAMRRLFALVKRVAPAAQPVLILGESGTGKELLAREIHDRSPRARKNFEAINTTAIPAELLESEMFGHLKGSFTHALSDRKGRFELADGGTIFLDEIGDMPATLQPKLLRVLQDGGFRPIGAPADRKSDFRLICATHRDLRRRIAEGAFREDLYYRVNVIPLAVPPLRERPEDIEPLVECFMEMMDTATRPRGLSPEALARLRAQDWPGNVRELQNVIQRAALLGGCGTIEPRHLMIDQPAARTSGAVPSARDASPAAADMGSADVAEEPASYLWRRVRDDRLRVTDLGEFKKQYGEAGLREVLRGALREAMGDYGRAMVLIGFSDDPVDKQKNATFRQMVKRMGLTRDER